MGIQLDQDKTKAKMEYKSAILEIGDLVMTRLARFWLHNDNVFQYLPIGWRFNKVIY